MSRYGLKPITWSGLSAAEQDSTLARPEPVAGDISQTVSGILQRVWSEGDRCLVELTRQFDNVELSRLDVDADSIQSALIKVDAGLKKAITEASQRINDFHRADLPRDNAIETAPGLTCSVTYRPLRTVGLYVPGGSAPLISTVLMLALPARLAGCRDIIMCTPPGKDGAIADEVLAAASLCGVDQIFCVGGAQAIAAMAYGTSSVPRCQKIFGPGNSWVTEAKQQVSLDPRGAAIDMPAGPSEVMVIADGVCVDEQWADFIAWDLLSQAEHGPDSQALLLTDSESLATLVIARLDELGPSTPRADILDKSLRSARIIVVPDIDTAMDIADDYAPEHLIINTRDAGNRALQVDRAGSVFIGPWTPESLGDYCSGTNHVLPTYGWARSHGALGVGDFMRRMTLQEASPAGLINAGPVAEILARAEGLDAHYMAVRSRLQRISDSA